MDILIFEFIFEVIPISKVLWKNFDDIIFGDNKGVMSKILS